MEGLGAAERPETAAAAAEQKRGAEPHHLPRPAEGLCPLLRPQDVLGCTQGKWVAFLLLNIFCAVVKAPASCQALISFPAEIIADFVDHYCYTVKLYVPNSKLNFSERRQLWI